jgi:hypothetical protein
VTLAQFPTLQAGSIVAGRYRVEGPLGSGGFGTVVRATQFPLGREVAIKVMVSPLGDGARFVQEAQTAQKLEHPNTIRILDFGQLESGLPFIVFELLRGESLAQLIARTGGLPLWAALRITMQVLKSLMEAHAHGIIHRDIKPANLFVTAHSGEPVFVKVLDFGVAKQLGGPHLEQRANYSAPSAPGLTQADQIIGTPLYMSPEQARGAEVGPGSDLYALGLVLVEMMTGRPVLDASLGSMAIALVHDSPEPLPLPQAIFGSPIERLVRRATAKDLRERYRSAQEMLAEVELLLAGTTPAVTVRSAFGDQAAGAGAAIGFAPTAAGMQTPGRSEPFARTAPRPGPARGLWVALAGGVVALGLFALGLALWPSATPSSKRATIRDTEDESDPYEAETVEELDLAEREIVPRTLEQTLAKLEDANYTTKRLKPMSVPGQEMETLNVTRPPCGGTVLIAQFPNNPHGSAAFRSAMEPFGSTVATGDTVLYVALDSIKRTAESRKNCSMPVLALLTRPKQKR